MTTAATTVSQDFIFNNLGNSDSLSYQSEFGRVELLVGGTFLDNAFQI